tara:strand:- start:2216 stop:2860 length:645 start_codon:yes stop_codon:yes gene_type:complete
MTQFTAPASLDNFKAKISSGSKGLARPNKFMVELPQSVPGNYMSVSDLNIMCKNVSLPGRQVTTLQKAMGLRIEKMANGFAVDDITFSFYVQNDYNVKKYFEAWQNLAVNQQTYELGYKSGPGGYGKQVKIHQLAALTGQFNPQAERSAISRRGRKGPIQFDGKAKDRALEKVIYTCVLEKAFPTTLNSIEMNSEQGGLVEVSIQLSYTDWRSE